MQRSEFFGLTHWHALHVAHLILEALRCGSAVQTIAIRQFLFVIILAGLGAGA